MTSAKDAHTVVGFLCLFSFGHLYVFSWATLDSYKTLWNVIAKRGLDSSDVMREEAWKQWRKAAQK